MGGSLTRGARKMDGFLKENPHLKGMMTGGSRVSGNHHMHNADETPSKSDTSPESGHFHLQIHQELQHGCA